MGLGVPVTNTHAAEHHIGGVVIPPGQTREVPFELAQRLRGRIVPGLVFDYTTVDRDHFRFRGPRGKIEVLGYDSPMSPYEGYGICGIEFVRECARRGVEIAFPSPMPSSVEPHLQRAAPDVHQVVTKRPATPALWGVMHGIPIEFQYLNQYVPNVIGHTMFEADRIPGEWVRACEAVRGLIVPSSSQVEIFAGSGVTVPIEVVPDPIDVAAFPFQPKTRGPKDPIIFFCWGRLSSRKMPLELIEVFRAAFGDRSDRQLILKTHHHQFGVDGPIEALDDQTELYNNVTRLHGNWPMEQIKALLYQADVAVFLSHGEGQMNPPLQAMAAGIPVICPDHSGCRDYARPELVWPIATKNMSYTHLWNCQGEWWNPDLDQAVELLRHVADHYEETRAKLPAARAYVERHHTTKVHVDGVLRAVDRISRQHQQVAA